MDELTNRWEHIQQRIQKACHRVGRDPNTVHVVAVTKYVDSERTSRVLDLGLDHIGESRVQDAVPKWKSLGDRGTWHFIGHLQRNKVKEVVGRFTYLHSLDRFSLAEEIDRRIRQKNKPLRCFIQVNVSGEVTKFGIPPRELEEFAREVANLSSIEIIGLMTMAPIVDNPEEVRPVFRELKRLQEKIQRLNQPRLRIPHLSMGMSRDFDVAIEEGATWVRLGSVLVGGGMRGG
ncbi:YggS family pyridoxal phosphate-dependent enzyme [Paenactinomyces guangxiensis]|uniref:Pyridoxal phosphate homeostasis protein n=1 Tax=Paenactinomyces guangxiensis TaxID=1490290 RepID=A0A7W1WQU4_9BACL|nr:YggS family pyridoxal phosphate-dependent enzyme [Paenactinomyces guangxiensis]MBA4494234.1 YggS family pyridoxal phosphate-dependent enzyme [Paenactinomyces guangxiensis]MBH8590730.1 YggS family pyridoxal phosphate-dependent enzyme [Paenactinomyces guangxiensis]